MDKKHQQYGGLKREDILDLKQGEVVRYGRGYLIVSEINIERGVVF